MNDIGTSLLRIDIVTGPLLYVVLGLATVQLLYLLVRAPTRVWIVTVVIAVAAGVGVAGMTWFVVVTVVDAFGMSPGLVSFLWFAATCSAIALALANLWRSRRRRKIVAVASVLLFLVSGTLAINASFGLNRTLGSLFGVTMAAAVSLPATSTPPETGPSAPPKTGPLYQSWVAPADLPAQGTTGSQVIPNTVSGFTSRPAGIYLPPAAFVANAPALPLVILLMGQPGNPDPSFIAATLDRDAAAHDGLAPIVIVADQLGDPASDPLCLDTPNYGKAETFITQDVVNWAVSNLNIIKDPRYWTIAGYSNGGQCAISFAAKHPDLFSNVVDISGEEFAGSESEEATLADVFLGDQAAYDAIKPLNLLAARKFIDTVAVFTVGSNDTGFIPGQQRMAAAATAAGMTVTYWESPDGGHVLPALTDGLDEAFVVLYPRLGLAPATG
ncbi:esterase [Salinibacterium xinjiangense]|uniref:Esterase n=1 Tax=Salinibacterium xinjiangense TaxID=386302 RepID=A0A2C8ZVC1_9MICO|nr:alpha/beta hydrolase-fold protein [Salinibacterium xinjiangense]GGL05582.1 esterase [Salinibacterium xinjiangense]SOE69681.1 Putative esterase [Salinibacterium xinjiangense]